MSNKLLQRTDTSQLAGRRAVCGEKLNPILARICKYVSQGLMTAGEGSSQMKWMKGVVPVSKEKLDIPAVGLGESSYHLASMLGSSFSVITVGSPNLVATQCRRVRDHLKVYALENKCASVRSAAIPVNDLEKEKTKQEQRVFAEATKAVEEGNADTIVLGCGGMLGVAEWVSQQLGVPVVIPAIAALKICEDSSGSGLFQSKRCFGTPPVDKKRIL